MQQFNYYLERAAVAIEFKGAPPLPFLATQHAAILKARAELSHFTSPASSPNAFVTLPPSCLPVTIARKGKLLVASSNCFGKLPPTPLR